MVGFTVRNLAEELRDRVDFEIITIDNFCDKNPSQVKPKDRSGDYMASMSRMHPWSTHVVYKEKLSHWNSKRVGVEASTGEFLLFCDSHCIVSRDAIFDMFQYYRENHQKLNGTLHLPLTYHIMEAHMLIYKLQVDRKAGNLHYTFSAYRAAEEPYEVPCMSTCGMMMSRALYDEMGGWPAALGTYGGGENFMNYTLASMGKSKWIMPGKPLCHHGDKRGYSWTSDDYVRNRTIANYLAGGEEWASRLIKHRPGNPNILNRILESVKGACGTHRELLAPKQVISMDDWLDKWGAP